ncbi:MAG: hypothetical protein ABL870_13515 [Sediminibacterium sp.]
MDKKFKIVCVFLYYSIFLSCNLSNKTGKQNDAILFLNKVTQLQESIVPSSTLFSDYLQVVGPIANNGSNYQLEQQQIDSLKNYYNSFMQSIDKATAELSNLNEFDTSFNIIQPTINHLEIVKNSYVVTIPTYLSVYKIGWDKASDSSRAIINKGGETLEEGRILASKQREIQETEVKKLMDKYKLSYPK